MVTVTIVTHFVLFHFYFTKHTIHVRLRHNFNGSASEAYKHTQTLSYKLECKHRHTYTLDRGENYKYANSFIVLNTNTTGFFWSCQK